MEDHNKRNSLHFRNRKARRAARQIFRKIVGTGTKKKIRDKRILVKSDRKKPTKDQEQKTALNSTSQLKIGAMNVNGMDIDVAWVIQEMIDTRGIDVSTYLKLNLIEMDCLR